MTHFTRSAALILAAMATPLILASCENDESTVDEPVVLELRILQPAPDGTEHDPFGPPEPTLHDILTRVWEATANDNVKGLLIRVGPLEGTWGSVGDLREALDAFRSDTRPIHCHFETADNVGYLLLSSSCDRISMSPAGTLNLVGPAAVMIYARSFLDRLGLEAEIIHMGRYKGAGDTLIRDDMPEEAKETMDAILDDLHSAVLESLRTRSEGDAKRAAALIDGGPYTSEGAQGAGLVDAVGFLREARDAIKSAAGVDRIQQKRMLPKQEELTLGQFLDLLRGSTDEPKAREERVAVVFVTGNIVDGERSSMSEAVSGPFVRAMERLEKDDDVKAVVMRVNSPGGSALASDRMWEAARQLAEAKPLIASVGDMAASGGYYIASAADEILAHPNSLVGSIGVVGGKLNVADLTDELGIHTYVLQRGRRAAWSTPVRGLRPAEREAFERLLESTYDRFIERVATGRKMEREAVLAAAEGRVMTAQDGRGLGLIDAMGGLTAALGRARARAGLDADSPVELWPTPKGVLDTLNELLSGNGGQTRSLGQSSFVRHPLPQVPTIEPWIGAALTLAREQVVLIPPYLFHVR